MAHLGTKHHSNRLTEDDVRAIRAPGNAHRTCLQLGAAYGVSGVCIWKIRSRKTWKHLV